MSNPDFMRNIIDRIQAHGVRKGETPAQAQAVYQKALEVAVRLGEVYPAIGQHWNQEWALSFKNELRLARAKSDGAITAAEVLGPWWAETKVTLPGVSEIEQARDAYMEDDPDVESSDALSLFDAQMTFINAIGVAHGLGSLKGMNDSLNAMIIFTRALDRHSDAPGLSDTVSFAIKTIEWAIPMIMLYCKAIGATKAEV